MRSSLTNLFRFATLGLLSSAFHLAFSQPAEAGPAFTCTGDIYQVQSGQLRIFDPITSTYQNVGPNNPSYNATGYNILDNFAYASQGGNLIRIMADGTTEVVFNLGFGSFSGDVDYSNNYYLRRNNTRYDRIDIATGAITTLNFSGPGGGPADVAFIPGTPEYLIGFSGGGTMFRYNLSTLTKENISLPGLPSGGFGAAWTDSNGRLLTFNNSNGILYEVEGYLTNSPTFTQVGIGDPSGNNDGFSCSLQPFPNLAPVALDDDFTTPVNVPVSGNVIVDNGNGVDNDPDGGPVTVDPTPITGPTNGTVTLAADGSFTYTPDPNFIGTDTFVYEITDDAGLTAQATVTITITGTIDFEINKTQVSGPNPVTAEGQVIGYEITLENIGDIPLTGINLTDTLPNGAAGSVGTPTETGGTGTTAAGQLDLNETFTYTLSYTATQDDVDAGLDLTNTASATTSETGADPKQDSAVTAVDAAPSFTITKDVDLATIATTGTLTYTITVDNTGTQTLTSPVLTDDLAQNGGALALTSGPTLSGDDGDGNLDVTETWVYTATYDVDQDNLDSGADIVNTASFDTDQTGAQSDGATTSITQSPAMVVTKTSDTATLTAPGLITYQIEVDNTGNVALSNLALNDTVSQGGAGRTLTSGPTLVSGDLDGDVVLDADETWIYAATYLATQDDIDNGADIDNAVTVTSAQGAGDSGSTQTAITQTPSFTIDKVVDTALLTAPDTLRYDITITNTGNVSLTGVSLTDDLTQNGSGLTLTTPLSIAGDTDGDNEVDVGETWVVSATFDALQDQIDDGADIVNVATFDADGVAAQSDSATTSITQTDALTLDKSVAAGEPTSFSAAGDEIDFTFVVQNTGNTTVDGPITITDDEIGAGLTCDAGPVLPGAQVSCTFTWTATQADVDAGSVTNTATASGIASGGGGITSPPQMETVTAVQSPELSIVKTIVAPLPTVFESGQILSYEYVVTNTGNVTLPDQVIVTDNLTTVSCPAPGAGLDPIVGGVVGPSNFITCTATYTIGDTDEELGTVNNVASASTPFDGSPVTSPSASAIFPLDANPVLGLEKAATPANVTFSEVGDLITYSFTLSNQPPPSGIGATLTEEIFINDNRIGTFLCYDPVAEGQPFRLGDTHICTATYAVTQDDLDAGEVTNEAFAETVFAPAGLTPLDVSSGPATQTVAADTAPSLDVSKTVTAGPDPAGEGDTISYQIVALNDGNQTLSNVMLSDPLLGALTCDLAAPVTLARGEALTCTGSYVVQQSDLDTQTVGTAAVLTNTATAAANDPAGTAIPPADGSVDHPLEAAAPEVSILKELFPDPAADPAFTAVGDVLRYRMTVSNIGNVTLSSVDVTDSLVAGTCTTGAIAPGDADATCFFEYTVDQADLDAGEVLNTASASAQPSDPAADPVEATSDLTSPGPDAAGGLTITKAGTLDVGPDGVATPGDLISYVFIITNTGNVTLSDVAVTDPNADVLTYAGADDADGDNDIDTLAPNSSATVTGSHALTQPEINAGFATNSAVAEGADPSGTPVSDTSDSTDPGDGLGTDDPTVTPIARNTGLSIVKTPSILTGAAEGDVITYSYLVTNTGNTDLTDVTLTDAHTSAAGTAALSIQNGGVIATLGAGDSETLTSSYTVTQDDIDAGSDLTNVVDVTGDGPAGTPAPTATDAAAVEVEGEEPALEALKTVRSQTGSAAGDTVVFEVTVENTGNVSISGLALADTLRRTDGTEILPSPTPVFEGGDGGAPSVLDVNEIWTYAVTYVLTQDDIDAGGINNSVTAGGTSPAGSPVSDVSDNGAGDGNDATPVLIPAMPALEAVKTITSSTVIVGETVQFAITVENTGNVTLSAVGVASDTLTRADGTVLALTSGPTFQGADASSPEGSLLVGETATYVASYVLTQDDIDAGGIANTASVTGTPPLGAPVTDVSDDDGPGDDPTVLTIDAEPEISMIKALATGSGPSFDAVGDVLDYTFSVTNEGNVTLTTPVTVADPLITDAGGSVTCPAGDVAPGDTIICTGSYSITQDDLDAGQVDNIATANVDGADPVTDALSVPALQLPELSLTKVADSLEAVDFVVGAIATYTYTTTNEGNVTITSPITVSDNLISPSDISCPAFPADGVAPGEDYVCTASYTVTGDDVRLGVVTNTASASDGTTTSPLASETIPNDAVPALSLEKEVTASFNSDLSDAGDLTFDEVGDILEYTFTVTNAGTQSFANDITIQDALFADPIVCFAPTGANPDLVPGEQSVCTGQYTITQADLDAGEVLNEAIAQTEFGVIPTIVTSGPATETTPADLDPMLVTAKTVTPSAYTAVDDTLTYDIVVTNTGNQTITSVAVSDPLLPALVCEVDSLLPGDTLTCSAPYTVTQADIDRGFIDNTATTSGIDPFGDAAPSDPGTATATGPSEPPTLELTKSASPSPFGNVGTTVTYTFAVQNTSIFTLSAIEVTDPIQPGFSCTIATLAPGDTDSSCFLVYEVTQADVDEQQIVNSAAASGVDPFGNRADDTNTITTVGPPVDAQIRATKLANIPATTLNSVVDYTLLIENPGNVSLNFITITDTMTREDGSTTSLDAPFAFVTGDANGDGLLTPGEIWEYTASHTITQADINAGGFSNSVEVEGTAPDPDGPVASDISDDGNDGDGNTEDDPTQVLITADPVLIATKTLTTTGAVAGDELVFTISARNAGNVDIVNVAVPVDTLLRADGTDISAGIVGPTPISGQDGTLSPAEEWLWEVRYTLTQEDVDEGGVSNSVSITGEAPAGVPVTDVSDDGDDTDGNIEDDPTVLTISPTPTLVVTKSLVSPAEVTEAGQTLTFEILATNTGNVTLSNVSVTDTLTNFDGDVLAPVFEGVDGLTAGALAPGLVATFTYSYVLQQADVDAGGVENTATVSGDTPSGVTISDVSDDDGTGTDDPTRVVIDADPTLEVAKTADTPSRQTDGSFIVNFSVTVANTGNVTHNNLSVLDDLSAFLGAATLITADVTSVTGLTPGSGNPGYDGLGDTELLDAGAVLMVGDTTTIDIAVRYDTASGALGGENTVTVSSDQTLADIAASTLVTTELEEPSIIATKTASPSNPRRGDVVTYTLTFENPLTTAEADLTLIDRLPVGLVYIEGSGTLDGAATPAPTRSGRNVIWTPVTIDAGSTVTLTLQARLIAGAGRYVNEAYALGANGARVSNTATAVIEVTPEAVFDCADVIGKVFDDVNGNGRQDGPDGRAITNDDEFDKFSTPREQRGEPGLPGARVVTTRGTVITADEYGRFSVPCAELPGSFGSNFTLKLDTRSLPTGYRVTTENPRVLRLTAGKLARMNFGARLGNVVDVDLIASAFQRGQVDMTPGLEAALVGMLNDIRDTPTVLRISYIRRSESLAGANARLDVVERFVQSKWKKTGRYRLVIERVVARIGEEDGQ